MDPMDETPSINTVTLYADHAGVISCRVHIMPSIKRFESVMLPQRCITSWSSVLTVMVDMNLKIINAPIVKLSHIKENLAAQNVLK